MPILGVIASAISGNLSQPSTFLSTVYNDNKSATSTDGGVTWTARTLPSSNTWIVCAYGNSQFLIVANASTSAATSTDGITWTTRTMPTASAWGQAVYAAGKWVVSGQNDPSVYSRSTDSGATWSNSTSGSGGYVGIAFGNSVFVTAETTANAGNAARYSSSTDTGTWSSSGSLGASTGWGRLFYGANGGFIVCNNLSNNYVSQSQTGTGSFTLRTLPATANWNTCLAYGNGTWAYFAYNSSQAAYSTNGTSWTSQTSPISTGWSSMQYSTAKSKFIAVSDGGTIATSTTGTGSWTTTTLPAVANYYGLAVSA